MYGDIDFIPSERYSESDANRAIEAASGAFAAARDVVPGTRRD